MTERITITNNVHNTQYVTTKLPGTEVTRDFGKKMRDRLCPDKCCRTLEPFCAVGSRYTIRRAGSNPIQFFVVDTWADLDLRAIEMPLDHDPNRDSLSPSEEIAYTNGYDKGYRDGYEFGHRQGVITGTKEAQQAEQHRQDAFFKLPANTQMLRKIQEARDTLNVLQNIDYEPPDKRHKLFLALAIRNAKTTVEALQKQFDNAEHLAGWIINAQDN